MERLPGRTRADSVCLANLWQLHWHSGVSLREAASGTASCRVLKTNAAYGLIAANQSPGRVKLVGPRARVPVPGLHHKARR